MIKLEFSEKNEIKRQKDIEDFCHKIYQKRKPRYKNYLRCFCRRYKDYIIEPLKKERPHYADEIEDEPFLYLMSAGFETLKNISDSVTNGHIVMPPKKSILYNYLTETLFRDIDHSEFIAFFDTRVCPYCNRNYIGDSRAKTLYHIDHFFPRDIFAILSVCFYNMVPSCASCNGIKTTMPLMYSPYEDCDIDAELKMSYILKSARYLHDPNAIDVVASGSPRIQANINALNLDNVYKLHSDTVQELLWKKMIYYPGYVSRLSKRVGLSPSEIERLVTGVYCDKENYGKRPLSKLGADISREIGLI